MSATPHNPPLAHNPSARGSTTEGPPSALKPSESAPEGVSKTGLALWFAPLAVLVAILVEHLNTGLVSDDFTLMIEDSVRPWYFSSDHLYRPVRNAILHFLPRIFGMDPVPYRSALLLCVLATLAVFYVLLRQLRVPKEGCFAALAFAGLYPRHEEVYYFWSASQDAFMALFFLLALVLWFRYRRTGSQASWLAAIASFAASLGFKEPAVCLPLLLLLWELSEIHWSWKRAMQPGFWRPYLGLAAVLLVFGAFVLWYREGRLYVPDPFSIYGYHGLSRVALPWVRTWANLLLPFSQKLSLRSLSFARLALLGLILLTLGAVQRWLRLGSALVVCAVAVAILIVPTSMFVGVNNGDQYLYLPSFAVAGFMGCVAGELLRRSQSMKLATALAIAVYVLFATLYLRDIARVWTQAADQAQNVLSSVRSLAPANQVANLTLLNVPHSNSASPILANGVFGALIASGYSPRLQLLVNHQDTSDEQQFLVRELLECQGSPAASPTRALLVLPEKMLELNPTCASAPIAADRLKRPLAWASF